MPQPVTKLRDLPRVDDLIGRLQDSGLPTRLLTDVARQALDIARTHIEAEGTADVERIAADALATIQSSRAQKVINATGVLLHTNLGRAPLSQRATMAFEEVASGFSNLELDLSTGERGGRGAYTTRLLTTLTGAEDALVVNNNAAAVLLALFTLAAGRAVPVSRGELIEIGGSYRLPSIMEVSAARLVEVGTTNRTRLGDYQLALQLHEVGAILKVHPSNYRVEGFTEEANIADLSRLAEDNGVPLLFDVGSGLLDRSAPWLIPTPSWLGNEPGVRQALSDGADLVTFSGDKLLGGPQAGIVVGARELVVPMRKSPLARALRVGAGTDAALAATLESYLGGEITEIPFWRMALLPEPELQRRSENLADALGGEVVEGRSLIGAGSVPGEGIRGAQVRLADEGHLFGPLLRSHPSVAA